MMKLILSVLVLCSAAFGGNGKSYFIIDLSGLTPTAIARLQDIYPAPVKSLRRSIDGTKAVLKFKGAIPQRVSDYFAAKGIAVKTYTHPEILLIMATPEWSPQASE